ncbi:MAG: hypothetical protein FJ098_01265, partial [Deltaproteobacteria bacterium]|nr:hypothetical protein [Deltaproteobacteria bacterium]
DWHTEEADTSTGLRLRLGDPLHDNALVRPVLDMFPAYVDHAELQDGFGAIGLVGLPVTAAPAGLPAVTSEDGPVRVVRVSDAADLPFRVDYVEYSEGGEVVRRLVELDPVVPLREGDRILVLVHRGLAASDGAPFSVSPLAEAVLGLRDPFGPPAWRDEIVRVRARTLEALAALPDAPAPEDLLLALHYTVGTSLGEIVAAAEQVQEMEIEVDLDPDGDGAPNVTPGPEHPSFQGHPQVGLVIEGRFFAPDFRNGDGILDADVAGRVSVHDHEWRDFWITVPAAPEGGPWPFAITQHGLNSWKETQYGWARDFASLGIASGCFDFMYHGKGKNGGFFFLALDVPRVLADNFRQSALDILAFERAAGVVAAELGLDLALDRLAYTGHSLGAIISSIACPLSRTGRVGGFVNGGGDFLHLIQVAFENMGLYDALPGDMWSAFRLLAGNLTSLSDPTLFARHLVQEPLGDRGPCPFQLQVSLEDATVPPRTGYELAVAAGAPLIEPVLEPWDWLTPVPPDGQTWGVLQFDGGHELFNGGDGAAQEARARGVMFHYLESFLHGGSPEIVWPE